MPAWAIAMRSLGRRGALERPGVLISQICNPRMFMAASNCDECLAKSGSFPSALAALAAPSVLAVRLRHLERTYL